MIEATTVFSRFLNFGGHTKAGREPQKSEQRLPNELLKYIFLSDPEIEIKALSVARCWREESLTTGLKGLFAHFGNDVLRTQKFIYAAEQAGRTPDQIKRLSEALTTSGEARIVKMVMEGGDTWPTIRECIALSRPIMSFISNPVFLLNLFTTQGSLFGGCLELEVKSEYASNKNWRPVGDGGFTGGAFDKCIERLVKNLEKGDPSIADHLRGLSGTFREHKKITDELVRQEALGTVMTAPYYSPEPWLSAEPKKWWLTMPRRAPDMRRVQMYLEKYLGPTISWRDGRPGEFYYSTFSNEVSVNNFKKEPFRLGRNCTIL